MLSLLNFSFCKEEHTYIPFCCKSSFSWIPDKYIYFSSESHSPDMSLACKKSEQPLRRELLHSISSRITSTWWHSMSMSIFLIHDLLTWQKYACALQSFQIVKMLLVHPIYSSLKIPVPHSQCICSNTQRELSPWSLIVLYLLMFLV